MATSITVRGLTEAVRDLDDVQGRLRDMSPVMRVIAEDLKTFVDDRFDTSTDPTGAPWAPLKASTLARRRNGSAKPLVDTQVLRNSVNARPGRRSVQIGTNVPYAGPHQFGSAPHLPRRAFLPFTEDGTAFESRGLAGEELEAIVDAIADYIRDGRVG